MECVLERDVPCAQCGYNLRGLPPAYSCPECGRAYDVNIDVEPSPIYEGPPHQALRFHLAAAQVRCTIDAARLVADCVDLAWKESRKNRSRTHDLTNAELLDAFQRYVRGYFNDAKEARDLLVAWRITDSSEVLRIANALVEARLVRARRITEVVAATPFRLDDLFPPAAGGG